MLAGNRGAAKSSIAAVSASLALYLLWSTDAREIVPAVIRFCLAEIPVTSRNAMSSR
jgi:hypothetical protein